MAVTDGDVFEALVAPYRRELHVHCYRMLGSVADADDALQETLTAAWRGFDGLSDRGALRAWLYRIATTRCLNVVRANRRRRPAEPVAPFDVPEPTRRTDIVWLQPYPDALLDAGDDPAEHWNRRETIGLAFVAALQAMPPRQAAALLLADVVGFSDAETAAMLGTTATAVKGLRQRARASLHDPPVTKTPAADVERLSRRFADAFVRGDVDAVVRLLTDDAWLAMPQAPHVYERPAAIARFLAASFGWRGNRTVELVATRANGQPSFACPTSGAGPAGVIVLDVTAHGIASVTRFLDDDVLAMFALFDVGSAAVERR